ncbi:MAG: type IIA DNA topoisomerase subunit B [Bacteroidales bacterium]|nr:type IIA DNA topoisomerase subunit B [Candidatus Liminaster caballi]
MSNLDEQMAVAEAIAEYGDDKIQHLEWTEHIRRRPGMYIGKQGDGSHSDDGIYILLKEVIDNSIDEYAMGFGKRIDVRIDEDGRVCVRDFGRGIPLGKLDACVSEINTGGKYDTSVFKKSVGLNGVGLKAVNALSKYFFVRACREGQKKEIIYEAAKKIEERDIEPTDEPNGTYVEFVPDALIFENYKFRMEFVETLLSNYSYLNTGLTLTLNGKRFMSKNGLADLLNARMDSDPIYTPIHLTGEDIEVVLTHGKSYGEEYYSFVNGQYTSLGGTHLAAFKEASARVIKEFFAQKNFEYSDIRNGMVAAISIKVQEPVFEAQTKTKLGSTRMAPDQDAITVQKFVGDFLKRELDNYLHRDAETAEIMLQKIQSSEKERKELAGLSKQAKERAKKVNMHNRKLRDCHVHYNDDFKGKNKDDDHRDDSCIFITEGDSASGSITKSRNVETQAVFSLRGKPLNCFGMTKKVCYENEEFNLLQAALNIEDGLDGLRYNKVIIATDADVDGMHIRLLMMTYFLQFFPELVRRGHVYILQTPLFRVRNKKLTRYCYSDEERESAIKECGSTAEITRFKGLGEISPDEFKNFIGKDMRLDTVMLRKEDAVHEMLEYYMGKNTMERQEFIINNLVVELDEA